MHHVNMSSKPPVIPLDNTNSMMRIDIIAIAFLPPSTGVGLKFLDPDAQYRTQDARRLPDGLYTSDDRLAAAIWSAISLVTVVG